MAVEAAVAAAAAAAGEERKVKGTVLALLVGSTIMVLLAAGNFNGPAAINVASSAGMSKNKCSDMSMES